LIKCLDLGASAKRLSRIAPIICRGKLDHEDEEGDETFEADDEDKLGKKAFGQSPKQEKTSNKSFQEVSASSTSGDDRAETSELGRLQLTRSQTAGSEHGSEISLTHGAEGENKEKSVRLDVEFSFSLMDVGSKYQPVVNGYLQAVEEVVTSSLESSENIFYDPLHWPFVQNVQKDGKNDSSVAF
jgi:hypothetical protein